MVSELERRVSDYLGTDPDLVVSFSSCTMAIAASLSTFSEGTVSLPDFTFIGSLRAAQLSLKEIEVCDVDPVTAEASYKTAEDSVKLFVAPFGAWRQEYLNFAGPVVFDCAASLGAMPNLGRLANEHVVCFSLHATKVLGSGEGGFAVFGSKDKALRARQWLNFGINDGAPETPNKFGANGKMSEVQASFALAKFDDWQHEDAEWRRLRDEFLEISRDLGLDSSLTPGGHSTPYWIIRMPSAEDAETLTKYLANEGIGTRKWWPGSISQVCGGFEMKHSKELRGQVLGLPFFRGIRAEEKDMVRSTLGFALEALV